MYLTKIKRFVPALILLVTTTYTLAFAQDDINLFDYWKYYSDAENALYKTQSDVVFDQLNRRSDAINSIQTPEAWKERQAIVKEALSKMLGPFPDKTPLNAKITGIIKRPDFRVEKVIYESMPGFYVTGALFLPKKRKGRTPAILFLSGHTEESFRYKPYQQIIINLVTKGFIVFAIDPLGQGERSQYFDPGTGKSPFHSVAEHCYLGNQCFLSGYSPAKYFTWDGIRAVDYLFSRKEVDPDRIGITGHSGGGTQVAYIAAMDDRILASAPECFITDMHDIMKSTGPQDAEQNLTGFTKAGLNHGDFIEIRAPKPTLILSVTRDFFSIQGARDTYAEARNIYRAYGKPDNLLMSESDTIHGTPVRNREARYAFFQKFLGLPGDPKDHPVRYFDEQELFVTETGQLATSLKGKTVFDLNKDVVTNQLNEIGSSRRNESAHLSGVLKEARNLSGFTYPETFGNAVFSGRYAHEQYVLEKYLIPGSGRYYLPALLYRPLKSDKKKLFLIVSGKGKMHMAKNSALIPDMVKQGFNVLLIDLPGVGELGPGYMRGYDAYFPVWYTGILAGTSVSGLWAADIIRAAHFAKTTVPGNQIACISEGRTSTALLLAAAFTPEFSQIAFIKPLTGYKNILTNRFYDEKVIPVTIPGALTRFDLPDLYALLAPRQILMINPVDGTKQIPGREAVRASLSFAINVYAHDNVADRFKVVTGLRESEVPRQILNWIN